MPSPAAAMFEMAIAADFAVIIATDFTGISAAMIDVAVAAAIAAMFASSLHGPQVCGMPQGILQACGLFFCG